MLSEQKFMNPQTRSRHISPSALLTKIDNQNAKIRMMINCIRDRSFRDAESVFTDEDASCRETNSEIQGRTANNRNLNRKMTNQRRHYDSREQQSGRVVHGDSILDKKQFQNSIFKQDFNLSNLIKHPNPSNNKKNQATYLSPRIEMQDNQIMQSGPDLLPHKKVSIFRIKSRIDDIGLKREPVQKSRAKKIIKEKEIFSVQSINTQQIIAFMNTLTYLHVNSKPQQICAFFLSIYRMLKTNQPSDPIIKRYKNCIYFGEKVSTQSIYYGMVWYFREVFYFGELQDGKKHGQGMEIKFTDEEIVVWKGKFVYGQKTGYFIVQSPDYRYYGHLKNGEFHGEGHFTNSLSQYQGSFFENVKQGVGWEKFANKNQYKGEYFDNKFDGQGELKAGNYYYKGLFKKGRPDGYGFERTKQFEYLGNFINGKKQGKGRLKTRDGTFVQCMFRDGLIVDDSIKQQLNSPKQIVLQNYLSKQLHALNEQSEEGTIENMLNEINNDNLRESPLSPIYSK